MLIDIRDRGSQGMGTGASAEWVIDNSSRTIVGGITDSVEGRRCDEDASRDRRNISSEHAPRNWDTWVNACATPLR